MTVRRAATWISTVVVAIVVALALPVSQLRTALIVKTCCCPDPSDCHCPDMHASHGAHGADHDAPPTMRTCHNAERAVVSPQPSVFVAPTLAVANAPEIIAEVARPALPVPHPAPAPLRPDAPS